MGVLSTNLRGIATRRPPLPSPLLPRRRGRARVALRVGFERQTAKAAGTGGRFRHILLDLLCNTKLLTGLVVLCSNFIFQKLLFRLGLLNDLLEQVDVIGKSLFAGGSQRASGQRAIVSKG